MRTKVFVLATHPMKFSQILPSTVYNPLESFKSVSSLKQQLRIQRPDILIIQEPIDEGVSWRLAYEWKQAIGCEILLMVPLRQYDPIVYQLNGSGVFVVSDPSNAQTVYQACEQLRIKREEIQKYQGEIERLKKKIRNDKLVNRAKLVLIESYHWSEEKAHHYIEQIAMNNSITKVDVAKELLKNVDEKK